ncbi:response regulator [Desertivirga brevis]|uniref:response regulator n=1 Tax=Desertivirga brevis TaxID=2810310 RepID=UPI001A95F367
MKRVVVFEKNQDILDIVTHVLVEEGYKVKGFTSEGAFISYTSVAMPDLILLDVIHITPEGTELCKKLKALESIKDIPVIVLSTHNKASQIKKICADEVIQKPFDIHILLQVVESHLAA